MTFNLKMSLLCAVCILLSGLLGSYKSFQINYEKLQNIHTEKNQNVSKWVSQSVEQKLMHLEASVSYLDKSTVESLKRFGARYFAYAYKKDNEWSIKWKILSDFGKEAILAEVGDLNFNKFNTDRRSWIPTKNKELIYVAPVELAKSHQLKSGFLIFGLNKTFFNFVSKMNPQIRIIDVNKISLHKRLPATLENDETLFSDSELGSTITPLKGESHLLGSYFSKVAQTWVVYPTPYEAGSYLTSPFFTYFLIGSAIALMIFSSLISLLLKRVQLAPLARAKVKVAEDIAKATEQEDISVNEEPLAPIYNFGEWLENVLSDDLERLNKINISLKTQFEDDADILANGVKLKEFIKRLVANSVISLEEEDNKEIQVQLVEERDAYQLIYVDSRSKSFPSGEEASVFLQTEGSMEGIDGIISYASWIFGDNLTVAKNGFCISVSFDKAEANKVVEPVTEDPVLEAMNDDRIEISENDTDIDLFGSLDLNIQGELSGSEDIIDDVEEPEEPNVSFDEVIEQFKMKSFEFNGLQNQETIQEDDSEELAVETPDDKGLIELKSGQFKLKIRSPKKRNMDVDR